MRATIFSSFCSHNRRGEPRANTHAATSEPSNKQWLDKHILSQRSTPLKPGCLAVHSRFMYMGGVTAAMKDLLGPNYKLLCGDAASIPLPIH